PFAFTVTIALAASLLVSLTIVPVLAFWFLRDGKPGAKVPKNKREKKLSESLRHPQAAHDEHATAMQRGYLPIVKWTLKHTAITLLIAVIVFGGTIAATPLMKTNFMGSDEQNSVGLTQTLAPGTSLDAQLKQVERVE